VTFRDGVAFELGRVMVGLAVVGVIGILVVVGLVGAGVVERWRARRKGKP
jgi:hypothetical protein